MSRPRPVDLAALTAAGVRRLVEEVRGARLVCLPTDTVYGVGGVVSAAGAAAIAAAKGRKEDKPLQVIYPTLELLERSVALEPRLRGAVHRLLPGPFTLVLPYPAGLKYPPAGALPAASPTGSPGRGESAATVATLGVRVPPWPRAARRLAELPFPLLASSANLSGEPAPCELGEIHPRLLDACDVILDAGPIGGLASTVVDLTSYGRDGRWRILRRGAVGEDGVAARLAEA